MKLDGEIKINSNTYVAYAFSVVNGETYLSLGTKGAVAQFHLTVPDDEAKSNLERKSLPEELRLEQTVKALVGGIVEARSGDVKFSDGVNGANLIARNCAQFALTSKFRNFAAEILLGQPIRSLGAGRTYAVWARRTTIPAARAA
jgi:hypothetical protein